MVVIVVIFGARQMMNQVRFEETDQWLIVSTPQYEAGFDSQTGGVAYIRHLSVDEPITIGTRERQLWRAFTSDQVGIQAQESDSDDRLSYEWNRLNRTLVFQYTDPLPVTVKMDFSQEDRIVMQAAVNNVSEHRIASFRFPYELRFNKHHIQDALLPMLPGAKLRPSFFLENNAYEGQYPGVMFASYAALRSVNGGFAIYDVNEGELPLASTEIGFKNQVDDGDLTAMVHQYKTWIEPGAAWQSPKVVLFIGGDYPDSIHGYRVDNRIDVYPDVAEKLDEEKESYYGLPMYKLDIAAIGREQWRTLGERYIDPMDHTGIIHLVGFQEGGHDEHYPDFIPPAARWGDYEEFRAWVSAVQRAGNKVVPYTNFSWWGVNAPTLLSLPESLQLSDIAVNRENGTVVKEDYGPHSGYVMDPGHPFVTQRIAEEHRKLIEEAGVDGIFEDQWGARNAPYMFNANRPGSIEGTDPSNAYFAGVQRYVSAVQHKAFHEVGIDVHAEHATGFMGSNYLWDLLSYRTKTDRYTDYYPMAGMLMRDKVLQYQHNLAPETMTSSKEMLRWNMAMGFQLSGDLIHGTENPWLDVAGVYQRELLSRYADQLVSGFEQQSDTSTITQIGTYAVTANWDSEHALEIGDGDFALAPAGVEAVSADGAVRGGVYQRYNGYELDPGDHYLVEVREGDRVMIYQPMGPDTTIRVRKGGKWPYAVAAAHRYDGTWIADLPVAEMDGHIQFDYIGLIHDQEVGYMLLSRADAPSEVKDVSFKKRVPKLNLTIGKPIHSTTNTAEAFLPINANDGDPYTYWESMPNRFPQSLTVDLGEVRPITSLTLTLPPLDAWEAREQGIEVWAGLDSESELVLIASGLYVFDPTQSNRVDIAIEGVEARHIRLTFMSNSAWPAAQISEFEIF